MLTPRDGKLVRGVDFGDRADALQAAGAVGRMKIESRSKKGARDERHISGRVGGVQGGA
jgi:hypothetical protein